MEIEIIPAKYLLRNRPEPNRIVNGAIDCARGHTPHCEGCWVNCIPFKRVEEFLIILRLSGYTMCAITAIYDSWATGYPIDDLNEQEA